MCEEIVSLVDMGVKGIVVGGLSNIKEIDLEFINHITS
jgi:copper homeostasis protein CutC